MSPTIIFDRRTMICHRLSPQRPTNCFFLVLIFKKRDYFYHLFNYKKKKLSLTDGQRIISFLFLIICLTTKNRKSFLTDWRWYVNGCHGSSQRIIPMPPPVSSFGHMSHLLLMCWPNMIGASIDNVMVNKSLFLWEEKTIGCPTQTPPPPRGL